MGFPSDWLKKEILLLVLIVNIAASLLVDDEREYFDIATFENSCAIMEVKLSDFSHLSRHFVEIGKYCFWIYLNSTKFLNSTNEGDFVIRRSLLSEIDDLFISVDSNEQLTVDSLQVGNWGLDRIDQEKLPLDNLHFQTSYLGEGVTIYLLDSGVFTEHEEFEGRAEFLETFYEDFDGHGHGTHTAGIAIGKTYGVARRARLKSLKLINNAGSAFYSDWLLAIPYLLDHAKDKPSVISASVGGSPNAAVTLAFEQIAEQGHIVVVSAGNDFKRACDKTPANAGGNGKNGGVITVAASSQSDGVYKASNFGFCVDLFAPGEDIKSAMIGGVNQTKILSGTSMACPLVAGVAATLLEKHKFDKTSAVKELFELAVPDVLTLPRLWEDPTPNLLLQTTRTTLSPTLSPTLRPTTSPVEPTKFPTNRPTTFVPTAVPVVGAVLTPTGRPTVSPTTRPTLYPSRSPVDVTARPTT